MTPSKLVRRARAVVPSIVGALLALHGATAQAGENYRWKDEEGNVHYGDKMPADAATGEHSVIGESGVVLEKHDPDAQSGKQAAGSSGETQSSQAGSAPKKTSAGASGRGPRSDELLLRVYATEDALRRDRDRQLEAIELRIELAQQSVENLESTCAKHKERLLGLPEDSAAYRKARKRFEAVEKRLKDRRAHLEELRAKKKRVKAQLEADIERYRELKSQQASD